MALFASKWGFRRQSAIASLVVSGFILFAAFEIFKSSSNVLRRYVAAMKELRDIALGFEKVRICTEAGEWGDIVYRYAYNDGNAK